MNELRSRLVRMARRIQPEPSVVTLTLDVARSGILPVSTRLFLKDHILKSLASNGFKAIGERILSYVQSELRPETDGLYLAAGPDLWEPVELKIPLANFFHVGRSPYLAPLAAALDHAPRVFVARCDERGAALHEYDLGLWTEIGRWGPVAVERDAERIVSGRSLLLRSTSQRTRAGIGGAKRDRFERSVEAETARMLDSVARRVASLHAEGPAAAVYLFGDAEAFHEFRDHLPVRLRSAAEFLGPLPHTEADLRGKVVERVERQESDRREAEILEFHERRAQGHWVALGPADVLAHRTTGRLARVFLDPQNPVLGFRCLACSALHSGAMARCGYCGGSTRSASLTQEIVAHALIHPPLPITFIRRPAKWLDELGGMAGLLSRKGIRGKR